MSKGVFLVLLAGAGIMRWRYAIGDPDNRPPRADAVRGGFQPNDVGTDEFMTLMDLLGVDPFISVNAGLGDEWSAAQFVEYANGAATTPMGRVRAANGHPAPYHISGGESVTRCTAPGSSAKWRSTSTS
jgi:alpha-L-arabinofuranosidase